MYIIFKLTARNDLGNSEKLYSIRRRFLIGCTAHCCHVWRPYFFCRRNDITPRWFAGSSCFGV